MRHIGELLKELGFNPDASIDTQKAFVRHLIKEAHCQENVVARAPIKESSANITPEKDPAKFEQLSFNFDESKKTG